MEPMYYVNLEFGTPDIKHAISSMEFYIASARARGGKLMKAWHGSTITESKGKLKAPIRAALRRLKREGRISFFIPGEQLNDEDAESRYLLEKYPFVKEKDEDWGFGFDCYVLICL